MAFNPSMVLFVILYGCNNFVFGYLTGAPQTACVTMTPLHSGSVPRDDPPPFKIILLGGDTYRPSQNITVILSAPCGTEQFAGFLLQARRADVNLNRDQPLGTFNTVAGSKHVAFCGNGQQAVTHVDQTPKRELIFQWTAPLQTVGHIVFAVTFASSKSTYWVKVYSRVIREENNAIGPDAGAESYPTLSTCSVVPTVPPTPLPMLRPEPMCGSLRSCFSDCRDQTCGYIVSWANSSSNPNGTVFELSTIVDGGTNRWMAIGFSSDKEMGEDKVVECVSFNNVINVYNSFNTIYPRLENKRNENPQPSDGVLSINASLVDSIFRCSFLVVSDQFTYINLSTPWHLMFATGKTASFRDTKIPHIVGPGKKPPVSSEKIYFMGEILTPADSNSTVNNARNTKSTGLSASASLLMITWSFIFTTFN